MKQLNKIKIVLIEQNKTAKWHQGRLARIPVPCPVGVQIHHSLTLKRCFGSLKS